MLKPLELCTQFRRIFQIVIFLDCTGFQDLGYLYKRMLAIEVVKAIQGLNKR